MVRKSKKKKSKAEKAQKHFNWEKSLQKKVSPKKESDLIPEQVSIIKEEDDSKKYLISFLNYLNNECQMDQMVTNKDRDLGYALQILKTVSNQCDHYNQLKSSNFTVKPVSNGGEYAKLYKGLNNKGIDIRGLSVYEAYIRTEKDGRMFFWSDEAKKIIYIITVRKNHYKL